MEGWVGDVLTTVPKNLKSYRSHFDVEIRYFEVKNGKNW